VGILAAVFGSSILAAAPASHSQASLAVLIYDLARVPPGDLARAGQVAAAIFADAGIEAEWVAVPVSNRMDLLSDFSAAPANGCRERRSDDTVRAQILPHAPTGFSLEALGYSLPCARRGIQVTLYADRIEAVSQHSLASFYRVLGHALAHEVGHVLLRSAAYENAGIMKPVWSRADWQRAAVTIIPFSPDQARGMREELREMRSPDVVAALQKARK